MGAKSTVRVVCAMCFSIAFVRIVIHSKATCAFSLTITIRWRWRKTIELKQNRMKTAPWAPKQTHNEKSRVQYSILANRSSLIFNMHSTIYMSVCVCVCVSVGRWSFVCWHRSDIAWRHNIRRTSRFLPLSFFIVCSNVLHAVQYDVGWLLFGRSVNLNVWINALLWSMVAPLGERDNCR